MSLKVETAKIEPGITVVRVSGQMTFEETGVFTSSIRALLDQGAKKLILDLSGVDQIDSLGGTSLIRCFFAARESAADLRVAGASPSVTRLFQTTKVDTLISFFPTMAAALDYFTVPPNTKAQSD